MLPGSAAGRPELVEKTRSSAYDIAVRRVDRDGAARRQEIGRPVRLGGRTIGFCSVVDAGTDEKRVA